MHTIVIISLISANIHVHVMNIPLFIKTARSTLLLPMLLHKGCNSQDNYIINMTAMVNMWPPEADQGAVNIRSVLKIIYCP